jgi:hypothetical protein
MRLTATYDRARDTQRQRLYDAERTLPVNHSTKACVTLVVDARIIRQSDGGKACSIEDCQRYVDDLVRQSWFQSRFGQRTITVHWKAGAMRPARSMATGLHYRRGPATSG